MTRSRQMSFTHNTKFSLIFLFFLLIIPEVNAYELTAHDGTTVTIDRDDYGIPHVTAMTEAAVFFGQAFAIAEDRAHQLDRYRRMAEGRMAESDGLSGLLWDQEKRRLGYTASERLAFYENLDDHYKNILQAYAAGINCFIDSMNSNPEVYKDRYFLNVEMQHWTVHNSIEIAKHFCRRYAQFGGEELDRLAELQEYGQEWFDQAYPLNNPMAPTTIWEFSPPVERQWHYSGMRINPSFADLISERRSLLIEYANANNIATTFGSYFIAVSEELSESGKVMMLGIPQMNAPRNDAPNFVSEIELHCPEFHVSGMSIAGMPGIIIGRSENFSWTFTSGITDNSDVYIDSMNSRESVDSYWFENEWQPFETITDTIPVRYHDDIIFTHYRTVHGPVLEIDSLNMQAFAMKTALWNHEIEFLTTILDLDYAANFDQFESALVEAPFNFNILYTDRYGMIKYWHIGKHQNREDGVDPRLPHKGDGTEEWQGFISFEDLPQATVNDQPYFINWNNKPVSWWNNGDNVRWVDDEHRVTYISDALPPFQGITFQDIYDLPRSINWHSNGNWQQAIGWTNPPSRIILNAPGQTWFTSISGIENPHNLDQWSLLENMDWKEWVFAENPNQAEGSTGTIPLSFKVSNIYPNPFNSAAKISIDLNKSSDIKASIYNILGQEVNVLYEGRMDSGHHQLFLDANNLCSGIYFVQVNIKGESTISRKVVFLK